jgi:hypothetical protein
MCMCVGFVFLRGAFCGQLLRMEFELRHSTGPVSAFTPHTTGWPQLLQNRSAAVVCVASLIGSAPPICPKKNVAEQE